MGLCLSDFSQSPQETIFGSWTKPRRVLLLGLDGAGKSTLLHKLKLGECFTVPPTNHVYVDMLNFRGYEFISWDLSGASKVESPWTSYLKDADAVIFVVDAADRGRIREAAEELHSLFGYRELKNAKLLVFANKQDQHGCMGARKIYKKLNLGIATGTQHCVQKAFHNASVSSVWWSISVSAAAEHKQKQRVHPYSLTPNGSSRVGQVLTSSVLFDCTQQFLPGVPLFVVEFKERECPPPRADNESTPAARTPELTLVQTAILRSNKRVLQALYAYSKTAASKSSLHLQFDDIVEFAVSNNNLEDIDFLDWIYSNFTEGTQRQINNNQYEKLAGIRNLTVYHWVRSRGYNPPINMIDAAAGAGNLELVLFLHFYGAKSCTTCAMDSAAANGHLDVVQFLHESRQEGCTAEAKSEALKNGHIEVLRFIHENRSEGIRPGVLTAAARRGRLKCIKYAHENNFRGFTFRTMSFAMVCGQLEVVKFLHENRREGCSVDALVHAWRFGHFDVVFYVLSHRPMKHFDSAIQEAKQRQLTELVKKLERCELESKSKIRFEYSEDSINIM